MSEHQPTPSSRVISRKTLLFLASFISITLIALAGAYTVTDGQFLPALGMVLPVFASALSSVIYSWPVSIALVALILIAALARATSLGALRFRALLLLLPLAAPLLIVASTGVAHAQPSGSRAWLSPAIAALSLFSLPLAALVVIRLSGFRWVAFTVVLFELWFTFLCAVIASLSLMGC